MKRFGAALLDVMLDDPSVSVVECDLGRSSGTSAVAQAHPGTDLGAIRQRRQQVWTVAVSILHRVRDQERPRRLGRSLGRRQDLNTVPVNSKSRAGGFTDDHCF